MILSLDTATDRPTFALGTPGDPGAERVIAHRHDLSREIDGAVRDLLAARQLTAAALTGVIVSDGPGSFTGLRIGIAFAKGLCRALGVPLLAAPSMLGAARAAAGDRLAAAGVLVVVDYDALRGQVYRAVYSLSDTAALAVEPPSLVRPDASVPAGAVRAGAAQASAAALIELLPLLGGPTPAFDPQAWEPDYGRPAEAEARLRARHAAG